MKKKLCSILLALTMVLTLLPVSALAEGGTALPEEDANGVITLTENVTIEKWAVTKDATLNLNGFSYTTSDCGVDISNGATLTIVDTGKNGKLTSTGTPICVAGANSKVVINSGTVESTNNYGIYAKDGGTAIVNGGTVHSNYSALSGNNTTGNMSFEINGGTLTANNGPAIYMPGQVTLKITGGILNGGISLRMGQVTISGGTINATTNTATIDAPTSTVDGHPAYAYSGNVWFADALYVFGGTYPNGDDQYGNSLNLTISGGTFNCTNDQGSAVAIYDLGKVEQAANVKITGGTFTTAATTRNAYQVVSLANIGVTNPEPGYGNPKFVGKVNSTISSGTFSDLSALDYLADGANVTVKLAADTQKDVVIPANTTVTLDLNGHKLTNASGHTITNKGNLTVTGNGTVDNISHGKAALYNNTGATATLNGGTFDRSYEAGSATNANGGNSYYTLKNFGTMTINAGVTVQQDGTANGGTSGKYSSLIANGWQNASTAGQLGKEPAVPEGGAVLTINGGSFKGGLNTIKNDDDGNLTIIGGIFTNYTQAAFQNHHIATVSGGSFNGGDGAKAVINCTVNGCAITADDAHSLTITGGNFVGAIEKSIGEIKISGGTYTSDPSAYVVPGYVASYNGSTYTVYYPVPVIPNNNNNSSSTTTKNPDGSTTTTTTDKATGAVTETTTTANGSVGTVKTDANGSTEISASISAADVKAAEQKNAPVIAPITVTPAASSAAAPVIKLSVPANAGEVAVAIPVVNANQGTVAVRVNPDGTEEIIKTAVVTENGLVLGVKGSMQIKVINNSKNFVDTVGHWAASDVDFVSARELFNGTAPALFSPEASMTRGMVVTVIARLAGENTDGGANWYDKGCAWAVANGVSDGTDPNGSITREQLAAMLYRYCGSPAASGSLSTYADAASVSAFASDAMQWCVNNGIINGMDGLLNPQGQATRAQVSAMFARYIRLAAAK